MIDTLATPRTPAPEAAASATPAAATAQSSRFTIRMDLVMEKTALLPERQRVAIRWLANYCLDTNQSHRDVAPKLKQPSGEPYSLDSLYHAFTGGRTSEQLVNIVEAIERFRKLQEERSEVVKTGFIETAISKKIWKYCRKALKRQRVGVIIGESQIGKTISLEEYRRAHNHGETRMLRIPVGCGYKLFLRLLAVAVGVPQYASDIAMRDAIMGAVDENMLIIVDELHEAFGAKGDNPLGVKIINFLREIYDRRRCGLVLCGTKVFEDALLMSRFARNLRQTMFRGMPVLRLPTAPSEKDLALFAAKYGLGPASVDPVAANVTFTDDDGNERKAKITDSPLKLQNAVVKADGLGRWLLILEEAQDLARANRSAMSWGKVLIAWDSFERDSKFQFAVTGGAS